MLSRFSDVLQTAADVLAPPATRFEDFEYHWKLILNICKTYDNESKIHIEDTRIPHHLQQMLQLIVDEEKEQQGGTIGPCLEAIVQRSICLLDALTEFCAVDRPPGARALALTTGTALLRRTRQPCVNSACVYRPLQRMLIQCNESPASPTEKEEVELLLTLCGLVRKEPGLANIFTSPYFEDKSAPPQKIIPIKTKVKQPKKNPLFDIEMSTNPLTNVSLVQSRDDTSSSVEDNTSCRSHKTIYDENDKFLLIDLLLSYLSSADNQVVLRASEGIMIVSSLPDDDIASLLTCSPVCESLIERLVSKYKCIPSNVDPTDIEHLNITWGYVAQDFVDKSYNKFRGYRELTLFFSWLDYCDTLMKECHPTIAVHLARTFRQNFLEATVECGLVDLHRTVLVTAVISKCLKVIDCSDLINEFSNWLVGEGELTEWPLLHTLINNCLTDNHDLTLATLKFFEAIIEKPTEHSIHRLVLCRLSSRSYYSMKTISPNAQQDERDRLNDVTFGRERERNREAMKQLQHENQVNEQITDILHHEGIDSTERADSENIQRVINSYLLLLPKAILSDPVGADYEQYIQDAHQHYQAWLDVTSSFNWPPYFYFDNAASSTHSYDSRPEADLHLDGVFDKVNAPNEHEKFDYSYEKYRSQSMEEKYRLQQNLESDEFNEGPFLKMLFTVLLALPDHPYQVNLHLTSIFSKLAMLPHPNLHEYLLNPMLPTLPTTNTLYKTLQELAKRLSVDIPKLKNYKTTIEVVRASLMSEDPSYDESGEHNQVIESLIVVEEFCKELAAIAFVKYQHSLHMSRL